MAGLPTVDETLARVALLADRDWTYQRIAGGLSHRVYLVQAGTDQYVLRILEPAVSAAGLGIPPRQEIANTVRAAESGVGAAVLAVLPEVPAVLLEHLPGFTLGQLDLAAMIGPVTAACRRLHAGPRFGNDFDINHKRAELLDRCARHDLAVPAGYADVLGTVDRVAQALAVAAPAAVPCHNDLLAENFIADGAVVRIVDYQLSGNNDPAFDLGDIAAEADFDPDQTGALAAAYFGAACTPALIARVRLNLVLSNVTWTLWFAVHHGLLRAPDSDFDYPGEAADKWRQALRDLDAPDLGRLIDTAAGRRTPLPRSAIPPDNPVPPDIPDNSSQEQEEVP
jgi:thiamine kinase-like enzyme